MTEQDILSLQRREWCAHCVHKGQLLHTIVPVWALPCLYNASTVKLSRAISRTGWNQDVEGRLAYGERVLLFITSGAIFSSCCLVGGEGFRAHRWQVSPSPTGHTAGETRGLPYLKKLASETTPPAGCISLSTRALIQRRITSCWGKHEQAKVTQRGRRTLNNK